MSKMIISNGASSTPNTKQIKANIFLPLFDINIWVEDEYPLTKRIIERSPEESVKSEMINTLKSFEDLISNCEQSFVNLDFRECKNEFIIQMTKGIKFNRFYRKTSKYLNYIFRTITKRHYFTLLCFISLSEDGVKSSSLQAMYNSINNSNLDEHDIEFFISIIKPLTSNKNQTKKKDIKNISLQILETIQHSISIYYNQYINQNNENIKLKPPSTHEIHFTIAKLAMKKAYEFNSNMKNSSDKNSLKLVDERRIIQCIRQLLRSVKGEITDSPTPEQINSILDARNLMANKIKSELSDPEIVRTAWVLYHQQLDGQHPELGYTTYNFINSHKNTNLKSELLNEFCSAGLLHGVSHFYVSQLLFRSLYGGFFKSFLESCAVNSYNTMHYSNLEKIINVYAIHFSSLQWSGNSNYNMEKAERLGNMFNHDINQRSVIQFENQDSISRVSIIHIKKLIDKGYLFRAKKLCNQYKSDVNIMLKLAQKKLDDIEIIPDSYHTSKSRKEKKHTKTIIKKLYKRRIRYEGLLLVISTLRNSWETAHKHFLKLCIYSYRDFILLDPDLGNYRPKNQMTLETLEKLKPKSLSKSTITNSLYYLLNFHIKAGENDRLVSNLEPLSSKIEFDDELSNYLFPIVTDRLVERNLQPNALKNLWLHFSNSIYNEAWIFAKEQNESIQNIHRISTIRTRDFIEINTLHLKCSESTKVINKRLKDLIYSRTMGNTEYIQFFLKLEYIKSNLRENKTDYFLNPFHAKIFLKSIEIEFWDKGVYTYLIEVLIIKALYLKFNKKYSNTKKSNEYIIHIFNLIQKTSCSVRDKDLFLLQQENTNLQEFPILRC